VIESYAPRLQESLRLFRERRISAVELEAHAFQIRISYVRDLERLLVPERRSETLWYRTDQDVDPTAETVIVRAAE